MVFIQAGLEQVHGHVHELQAEVHADVKDGQDGLHQGKLPQGDQVRQGNTYCCHS